ncbi:MAG: glycosyltransferase family 2 protein [Motiliproteus sp.]
MKTAVVVPCYRVRQFIVDVVQRIGPEVDRIYLVDDACPEQSGDWAASQLDDQRIEVIYHSQNLGVGGAVLSGYRQALAEGADLIVKLDGDGQMDPALIATLIQPILRGDADYTKGNRFWSRATIGNMPGVRIFGNAALGFITKMSSGYWRLFDPTNGFTAIHRQALMMLDQSRISPRYFFESDMLIQLGDIRAVVVDVPMHANYGEETSGLSIRRTALEFLGKHLKATIRRIIHFYFLRDFSIASLHLLFGTFGLMFGLLFGGYHWCLSMSTGLTASTGTVMLAALPTILGFQLFLQFLSYDIANLPTIPLQRLLITAPEAGSIAPKGSSPENQPPDTASAPTQSKHGRDNCA